MNLRSTTMKQRLYASSLALVVLLLGSIGVSFWTQNRLSADIEELGTTATKRLQLALEIDKGLELAYSAEKTMMLAVYDGDKARFDKWDQNRAASAVAIDKQLQELDTLVVLPSGKAAVATLREGVVAWTQTTPQVMALMTRGEFQEGQKAYTALGNPIREKNRAAIKSIIENQTSIRNATLEGARSADLLAHYIQIAMVIVVLVVGGLALFAVFTAARQVATSAQSLDEAAAQVLVASQDVAGSAQSLSQGATEQAASLEETSASMEEMASMTRRNAENSQQAAAMMAEAERLVHGANEALGDMEHSMSAIKESSDKVSRIIKTIDEIAFQTNILALNAAVEAARAGEAGMGFAVVADEVRALAQRSAQAAKDTAALIEESIQRANEGNTRAQQVTQSITAITESSAKVKGLIDEVSSASQQQAQGIDQVSQAVAQMEKVTQTTAATAEESAAASEELSAQAQTALGVVKNLSEFVGAAAHKAAPVAPRAKTKATVVAMEPVKTSRSPKPMPTAEEQFPLEATGTFGKF